MPTTPEYHRAILRVIQTAAERWGKRPARKVVLDATVAALLGSDHTQAGICLDQLVVTGFVAERDGRYSLTPTGEQHAEEAPADQERRIGAYLGVSFKAPSDGLTEQQREILFLVGAAEHYGFRLGANAVGEALQLSTRVASVLLAAMTVEGYLERVQIQPQITVPVYSLTKAGRFELRRGPLRLDSVKYPASRSERATELVELVRELIEE